MDIRTGYVFGNAAHWWYLFLLAGVFALSTPFLFELEVEPFVPYLLGGGMLLAAVILRTNWYNFQVDTDKGMYREGVVIFGFRTGEWFVLPPIDRIVETAENVSFWNTPNGVSPTFKSHLTLYTIGLFEGDSVHLFVQSHSAQKARESAASFRQMMNLA